MSRMHHAIYWRQDAAIRVSDSYSQGAPSVSRTTNRQENDQRLAVDTLLDSDEQAAVTDFDQLAFEVGSEREWTVHTNPQVIGVLGGMGPAATADFYAKLVNSTVASSDQEHPRAVIWSDPTIPDRTQALLEGGEDPTPWLLRGVKGLEQAGATMIAVPCNTAHAFVPALQKHTDVPILHMIDKTTEYLAHRHLTSVGLLATSGTARMGLYQDRAIAWGLEALVPDEDSQQQVMAAILEVKGGRRAPQVAARMADAASGLVSRGAQAVIAGCTEIPLVLSQQMLSVPLVDPTQVLAEATLAQAGYSVASSDAGFTGTLM